MERKDLKPAEEMLLNLYNDNHERKIKLEKVKEFCVEDGKLCIVCEEYDEEGMFFGYVDYTMDITLNNEDIVNYNRAQYSRAIELAVQAIHNHRVGLDNWLSIKEIYSLKEIYENYTELLDDSIVSVVSKASHGDILVDTDDHTISYYGDSVEFSDMEGSRYQVKLGWLLSSDLTELSEYLSNYKENNKKKQIEECKKAIEKYRKWILESEEELKLLEVED